MDVSEVESAVNDHSVTAKALERMAEETLRRLKLGQGSAEKILKSAAKYASHLRGANEAATEFLEATGDFARTSRDVEGDTANLARALSHLASELELVNERRLNIAKTLERNVNEIMAEHMHEWKKRTSQAESNLRKDSVHALKDLKKAETKMTKSIKKKKGGSQEDFEKTVALSKSLQTLEERFARSLLTEERGRLCIVAHPLCMIAKIEADAVPATMAASAKAVSDLNADPGREPSNHAINQILHGMGAEIEGGPSTVAPESPVHGLSAERDADAGSHCPEEDELPPPPPPELTEIGRQTSMTPPPPPPPPTQLEELGHAAAAVQAREDKAAASKASPSAHRSRPPPLPGTDEYDSTEAARKIAEMLNNAPEHLLPDDGTGGDHMYVHRRESLATSPGPHRRESKVDPRTLEAFAAGTTLESSGSVKSQHHMKTHATSSSGPAMLAGVVQSSPPPDRRGGPRNTAL